MSTQQHIVQLLSDAHPSQQNHEQEWLALLDQWEKDQKAYVPSLTCFAKKLTYLGTVSRTRRTRRMVTELCSHRPLHGQISSITTPALPKLGNHLVIPELLRPFPYPLLLRRQDRQSTSQSSKAGCNCKYTSPTFELMLMYRQLPAPSQFISLTTLLSSERSNDDIQLELVEILGFEGDGLALVEELLRPGVREALLNDIRGGPKACHVQ
jgi:hypothetical protein